jgi:hypothetical protein
MGREQHRRARVGEAAKQPQQLAGARWIEARRRLVQEEDIGASQQLDGDAGALALTAGQGPHPHAGALREVQRRERTVDRGVDLGRRMRLRQAQGGRVAQRALKGQLQVDDVVLRHVAEQPAEAVEVPVQVDSVESHRTAVGRPHSRQGLQ